MIVRKEIRCLNADELVQLRRAFAALQSRTGAGGYQELAGLHGVPRHQCPRHSPLLLPWRRAYLVAFERALRDAGGEVSLPYWDWTSEESRTQGLPEAHKTPSLGSSAQYRNPLYSALIQPLDRQTTRKPRAPMILAAAAAQVALAEEREQFWDATPHAFSTLLEGAHDSLHTWVRGDLGAIDYAAYDPLFWSHQAHLDRRWAAWQRRYGDATVSRELRAMTLEPFGVTVEEVLDHRNSLDYDYEGLETPARVTRGERGFYNLGRHEPPAPRVLLHAHGLRLSAESFNLDVFVNQPEASAATRLEGNPRYAGTIGIFGMGSPMAHGGHLSSVKGLPPSPPRVQTLDLTLAVGRVVPPGEEIAVKLVVTDHDGREVDVQRVPLEGLSLEWN